MAIIDKKDIIDALRHLGELASNQGDQIELILVGGAVMVLVFDERQSTRGLDVLIVAPPAATVRELARVVAAERDWPEDWLNDGAKGYLVGHSVGDVVFSGNGIVVRRPSFAQLAAMKLSAWRDELDISDARRLMKELSGDKEAVWNLVTPHVVPGNELKSRYAFEDLWEELHGQT